MSRCNGGYLRADLGCPTGTPNSGAADHVGIDAINGIWRATVCSPNEASGLGLGILATAYLVREWGLPSGVVLLDGDGPTWIALDYRSCGSAGEPSVVWLDVDGVTTSSSHRTSQRSGMHCAHIAPTRSSDTIERRIATSASTGTSTGRVETG
jgi:hypothetical protein